MINAAKILNGILKARLEYVKMKGLKHLKYR